MQRKREPLHSLGHRIGSLQSRGGNGFFLHFFFAGMEKRIIYLPRSPNSFFHSILPSFNTHPRQTGNYSQKQWRFFLTTTSSTITPKKFCCTILYQPRPQVLRWSLSSYYFSIASHAYLGQKSLPWHVMPACTKYAYHLGKRQSWYGAMSRISLG